MIYFSILNVSQHLADALVEGIRLLQRRNVEIRAEVADAFDWTHDARRSRPKELKQLRIRKRPLVSTDLHQDSGVNTYSFLLQQLTDFGHVERAFGDLEISPLTSQRQDRVSGDAWQDEPVQGRGLQLLLSVLVYHEHENVHCAGFGDLVIVSVEPQRLLQPQLDCLLLYVNRGRVIRPHFAVANSAGPRASEARVSQQ